MADLSLLTSPVFDSNYSVTARLVMCHDIVHRKNTGYAKQALQKSGFATIVTDLIANLPDDCKAQILGDVKLDNLNVSAFIDCFQKTKCKYYINKHDEKMCTVEFACKFKTKLKNITSLPDHVLAELHLEIETPVGTVQA